MNNNFLSAINAIDSINKSYTFGVYIPSLGREVQFTQMTTAQQKAFIKNTMAPGNTGTSTLVYATHSLLKNNCAEPDVNVDEFTLIDKIIACTMIRIMSVGDKMSVTIGEDEEANKQGITVNIQLTQLYNQMLEKWSKIEFKNIINPEKCPFTVEIGIPTVGDELKIEQDAQEKTKKRVNDKSNQDEIAYTFGELFLQEIVKFVRKVTINQGEDEEGKPKIIEVNMLDLPTRNRLDLLEKLPSQVMSPAIVEINKIVEQTSDLQVLNIDHEGQHYEYKVEVLNSAFFTVS